MITPSDAEHANRIACDVEDLRAFRSLPLLDRIREADKWARETPHEIGRQIKRKIMTTHLCAIHPDVDSVHAWGCPDCVAELRRERNRLRDVIKQCLVTLEPQQSQAIPSVMAIRDCVAALRRVS